MNNNVLISPRNLARALDMPAYLFSDMQSIRGEILDDGSVIINDCETPSINGKILVGNISKQYKGLPVFSPMDVLRLAEPLKKRDTISK